jgi:serine/threonine protein kinase/TPR repeat protein
VDHGADLVALRNEPSRFAVTAPGWGHVKELLHQAIALGPESRAKFLDEVCESDAVLRAELESLLAVGDGLSAEFLESPSTGKFSADGGEFDAAGLGTGQLFAQRFQLIRKLGEGGMGQVWLAEQTTPVRRSVALKLVKAGMYDETVLKRFQSERQSLAIMDHPAIAKVFDAGATPLGQPYFVMEYVPGLPITEYCDQRKLKIRERLELFILACEGVQHAHQKAIIHRDLKPANLLIVEVDGEPKPRIIDFGLAKATTVPLTEETLHTRFGQFLGTPGYMSPEQVDPNIKDIDTRTDVYSLGVILYVLLTGLQPFETKRREKPPLDVWLRQLREEEPPSPSTKLGTYPDTATATSAARGTEAKQLASELKGDLDWIAMKALERDRERRYGTPAELAADLRRYLNDEPVSARPASGAYQLGKFIRRHRVAAAFAAMVTLLSIVASAAALIAVRKQHEAEYQTALALQAQSGLLTEVASERLKEGKVASAQGIILEVLERPDSARLPATISVFQEARAADSELGILPGHRDTVWTANFSPDGKRIASASLDATVRIWEAATGSRVAEFSAGGTPIRSFAFSPDGSRIVVALKDHTARIWDARLPAGLEAQIAWQRSAQFDPLPDSERVQLGLQPDPRKRKWPADASACDQAAAAIHDPDRMAPGLEQAEIAADIANAACSAELVNSARAPRLVYQEGRALLAKHDTQGARRQLESAVSNGYRAARIDLADLLTDPSTTMFDPARAADLYQGAWQDGVPIAAFRLGHLYEYGLQGHDHSASVFQPSPSQAWLWYQRGVDAREPNAVARFAERDERDALAQTDLSKRNAQLLQAFQRYAAAAERAHEEDWPDEAWKYWRYRRATLARLLAQRGMMQQVADAYAAALHRGTLHAPTLAERVAAKFHR